MMNPPDEADMGTVIGELNDKLPGLSDSFDPDHPGMHTTATLDYEYSVSGRCLVELDDGVTRELGPGDTVIQNGTRHALRNPFAEPCVIVVALVGAQHDRVPHD